jgi:hypothetical protein
METARGMHYSMHYTGHVRHLLALASELFNHP